MADEQRDTLKKKIQILFQLGKFPDVAKLCVTYKEKFGQDAEVDLIRFKCDRHMGGSPSGTQPPPPGEAGRPSSPAAPGEREARTTDPSIPLISPVDQSQLDELAKKVPPRAAEPDFENLDLNDPFASDDLVVSDPFIDEASELRLAPEPTPVILPDAAQGIGGSASPPAPEQPSFIVKEAHLDADVAGRAESELELDEPAESDSTLQFEDVAPDFANLGGMTLDAEPELIPAAPASPEKAVSQPPLKTEEPAASYHGLPVGGTLYPGPEAQPRPDFPQVVEEPMRHEELPQERGPEFVPRPEREAPSRRRPFPVKTLLFILMPLVAAAAAAWLLLAGKPEPAVPSEPPPRPQTAVRPPARKDPRPTPAAAAPVVPVAAAQPQAAEAQQAEREKEFNEKLKQAENLLRLGDLVSAQAILQEAKKIQVTDALRRLEEQVQAKAAETQEEPPPSASDRERESQALAKARESNTLPAWRDFVRDFPNSESLPLAQARIASLEKAAQREAQQRLLQRIRQERSVTLRGNPLNLSQAEVAALAAPGRRVASRFEPHAHGNATVTLDLATGLMWSLYNRPMALDKAKWWANRVTAGYSGWRLPTVEEALTLREMDRGQYAGLPGFAVWTGDAVSDQPRSAWVLQLPPGRLLPRRSDESGYVWAVRQAAK